MAPDLVAIGRANLDLYSQSIGEPFENATGFDAMVGGSPTNIAIGVRRLGHRAGVITGVGDDTVGDFVLRYLTDEGVDTTNVVRVPGKLTSLALLGVQPPDHFPLTFYRTDPADIHLTVEAVDGVDFAGTQALEVSGNALARGPCVDATHRAMERARAAGSTIYMDVDLRPSEWPNSRAFGDAIRAVLPGVDVLIGTEEEFTAAFLDAIEPGTPAETAALDEAVVEATADGPGVVITKRGPRGATVTIGDDRFDVPGFTVGVVNTVGAGDAFAAGLITMRLEDRPWVDAVRFGNACGAIVVTRHGCSAAFPTRPELDAFLDERGMS